MIEQVIAAFERQDYQTAASLLQQLRQNSPDDPWVQFYVGRLYEVKGSLEAAETAYRSLLRATTNSKIMAQARQGLARIEAIEQKQRKEGLARSTSDPVDTQEGVLVIEPMTAEVKLAAFQKFARIMQLDPYIARLHLPTRSWRLYRTGAVGEMRFYGQQLQKSGIPCFWTSIADVQKINTFRANYINSASSQCTVICQNEQNQVGSLSFDWSEVTQRVEGLLPIFEQVVEMGIRRKLERKTKTLDYALVCDLHLPQRRSILRLCDRNYQFQQGITLPEKQPGSTGGLPSSLVSNQTDRINWNNLIHLLNQKLPQVPIWSDFTNFAEPSIDRVQMLSNFKSYIDLSRREDSPWDRAFHLYSSLVFLKPNKN